MANMFLVCEEEENNSLTFSIFSFPPIITLDGAAKLSYDKVGHGEH